jgi:hypothetical protein
MVKEDGEYHRPDRTVCKVCVALEKKEKQRLFKENAPNIVITCNYCKKDKPGVEYRYGVKKCKECTSVLTSRSLHKPTADMPDKCCTQCSVVKTATMFRHRTGTCKECEKHNLYEWRKHNTERFKDHLKKYRATPEHKEKRRCYLKDVYHSDINIRVSQVFRNRIRAALKSERKQCSSAELLGCTMDFFRKWLEFNFTPLMDWNNFGEYWHIDHIWPCAAFDLSQYEQQQECFSWKNMVPLEKTENMKKGAKIYHEVIEKYENKVNQFLTLTATLPN